MPPSGAASDAPEHRDEHNGQDVLEVTEGCKEGRGQAGGVTRRMDNMTRDAYDREARHFADDWETQPSPSDLYAVIRRFFIPGPTADIGCGSGRDTAWLNAHGYPAVGYDASEGLLVEARLRHPEVPFSIAALPTLEGIPNCAYDNVLCETVIMHLAPEEIAGAVQRLLAILALDGILCLTWRVTVGSDRRDEHGRLYSAFEAERVLHALRGTLLFDEQAGSTSSGKLVRRIVAKKTESGGLTRRALLCNTDNGAGDRRRYATKRHRQGRQDSRSAT
jgi:SAM-dependent methyltransferase